MDKQKMDRSKIKKTKPNLKDIEIFFDKNKSPFFRYYDKREFNIIDQHVYTSLYLYDDVVVGYGHIDREDGKDWLGIFIPEIYRSKGIGKIVVMDLLENSKNDIYLTVDKENKNAIRLYEKMNFFISKEQNNHYLMIYKNKN